MPSISLFGSAVTLNVIVAFLFALIMIFLLARLLVSPLRGFGRYVLRVGIVTVVIIVINAAGQFVGFAMPLNLVTIAIPTVLGVPGLVMVALLQFLLI